MHPVCILTVDGRPVSNLFMERLLSVTVTDKEGTTSDTIDLDLEAQGFALPRRGAIITCQLGYTETGVDDFGTYKADDVTLHFLPYRITVQGKAADMRETLKEHGSKHWDGQTFGGIVQEMAGKHGLQAQVDGEIASYAGREGYFFKGGESDLHWIERHARNLGGIFSIKDGKLIVAKRGAGLTAGGTALGGLVVKPPMVLEDTGSVTFGSREEHKNVRAPYHDLAEGKRKYEEAPAHPEGQADYVLRRDFATQDGAKRAAESRGKELQRQAEQTSVTIEGNIAARGGAPMSYAGIHPDVDDRPFIIETATHTFTKSGYTTQISAKRQVT